MKTECLTQAHNHEDIVSHTGTYEERVSHTGTHEERVSHTGTHEERVSHTGTHGTKAPLVKQHFIISFLVTYNKTMMWTATVIIPHILFPIKRRLTLISLTQTLPGDWKSLHEQQQRYASNIWLPCGQLYHAVITGLTGDLCVTFLIHVTFLVRMTFNHHNGIFTQYATVVLSSFKWKLKTQQIYSGIFLFVTCDSLKVTEPSKQNCAFKSLVRCTGALQVLCYYCHYY